MTLLSQPIPNMVGGVSQQPASLRQRNQSEFELNTFPSPVDGLGRRPPTEQVAKVSTGTLGAAKVHLINRDAAERYAVILIDDNVKVYDLATGTEKTVAKPDGVGYLNSLDPVNDFKAVTVADYTFIVNSSVTPAMETTLSAALSPGEALVFISQTDYGIRYEIDIDGVEQATYSTVGISSTNSVNTDVSAADLKADLVTNLGAGWTITQFGHVIHIVKDDASDFDIEARDNRANTFIHVAKGSVEALTDLPTLAPDGFRIKIAGTAGVFDDDYYVQFVAEDTGEALSRGEWQETIGPSIKYIFDAATMPHTLVRETSGDFTFAEATWGNRVVGDDETASLPSFIGYPIQNAFFTDERLCFLARGNVVTTRTGEFFECTRETVTTILDTDPIDLQATDNQVHTLRNALVYDEGTFVFSDTAMFRMAGSPILTPNTTTIKKVIGVQGVSSAQPALIGTNVYFAEDSGDYSHLREYFTQDDGTTKSPPDVSAHVPEWINGSTLDIAGGEHTDIVVMRTDDDPCTLYTYKYFWSGDEKLQSAWGRWCFPGDILGFGYIDLKLYLLVQYADAVYLETITIDEGRIDDNTQTVDAEGKVTQDGWLCHLDRRITDADFVSAVYSSSTDLTTITLPYSVTGLDVKAITRATSDPAEIPGVVLTADSATGTSLVLEGDHSLTPLWVGIKYTSRYRFSPQFVRSVGRTNSGQSLIDGRTQVLRGKVQYARTGFFMIDVTPAGRATSTYEFTGRIMNDLSSVIDQVTLVTGSFSFGVKSRNDRVDIDVYSDSHLPFFFQSATYELRYSVRSRSL